MTYAEFRACLTSSLQRMERHEAMFEALADLILQTPEEVIVTAIGKSSYIAQKFAASLRSIGVPSYFLHAAEAGHGDIGNVTRDNIVIAISKSGTTSEINGLIPDLKARGCVLVAITNRETSPLARTADHVIPTEVESEGEPLNTVPLVSTQAALFACDYLVALVLHRKNLTKEHFLFNHPAGQIGVNLRYRLNELVNISERASIAVGPEETAMHALLATTRGRVGAVAIVDEGKVLRGYLTDGDFRRLVGRGADLNSVLTKEVMNTSPVSIREDMRVGDVLETFEQAVPPLASAPVLDVDGLFAGIVSVHDLIKPK